MTEQARPNAFSPWFMFATGIDSGCPVINGARADQMALCGHDQQWRRDFELAWELGVRYLRWGPPLHRVMRGAGAYDWSFSDAALEWMRRRDMIPIVDLCRFGAPDWIGDFQNPDFPALFAAYARAFAVRYRWVQLYTPVSEIYLCALRSGRLGQWNEALSSDRGFVTALKHLAAANVLAMRAILEVRPDAIFIQSERTGYYHADAATAIGPAERLNDMRFLSLDLSYGHRVNSSMYEFLRDNGLTREEYDFFMETRLRRHCVLGADYYEENELRVSADGGRRPAGETLGYNTIVAQYHARYPIPVMLTETHADETASGGEAVSWLWKEWASALRVRNSGIPLVGFTWYPLVDQVSPPVDGTGETSVKPVGLFDLERNIRPVGVAYTRLIQQWHRVLPAESVCLIMPIILPSEYEEPIARRRRSWLREFHTHETSDTAPNPFGAS